jgi:hypothetical protein
MVEILEKLSKEIIMDNKKIDTEKQTLQALFENVFNATDKI